MNDLRSFINEQNKLGRVERVFETLDPAGPAARLLARREGQIVLLEQVAGYQTPVVAGVSASRQLLSSALGTEPDRAAQMLAEKMDERGEVEIVTDAPFLEQAYDLPDISSIVPLLRYDPGAEHPYTSACIVVARSRQHGMNLSFHRMMYLGANRFSVRIVPRHLRKIIDEGGGVARVAVICGNHPALCLAAATSGGPGFDELAYAAALMGKLEVIELGDLLVPAGAELVMVGTLDAHELAEEGPFVDLTGTLDGVRQQPVLTVKNLYHRPGFLYQVIVPGGAEHRLLMGSPQEPRMWRAVSNAVPCLHNLALSAGGCHWLHVVIALHRPLAGQARNAALAALGAHPSLKRVVVVDDDVDVLDPEQVEWAIATRVQADGDVLVVPGARGSSLDPSRNEDDDTTAKWVIDATIKPGRPREAFERAEPSIEDVSETRRVESRPT